MNVFELQPRHLYKVGCSWQFALYPTKELFFVGEYLAVEGVSEDDEFMVLESFKVKAGDQIGFEHENEHISLLVADNACAVHVLGCNKEFEGWLGNWERRYGDELEFEEITEES